MDALTTFDTFINYITGVPPYYLREKGIRPGRLMNELINTFRGNYESNKNYFKDFTTSDVERYKDTYYSLREGYAGFLYNRRPGCRFLEDSLSYLCFNTRNPFELGYQKGFTNIIMEVPYAFTDIEKVATFVMNLFSAADKMPAAETYYKLKAIVDVMNDDSFSKLWMIIVNRIQYTKKRDWF